ncbi:DoxX family protein [Celeribacter indicus]|uniref:DoxX family protein n=1 Tax=Celeribacter indicus TaxID=1208324 RepID=A0A0B5E6F9_9RHOB|nr:DoxX family protein [Celeribacter indicus]AJE49035.1 DoxX family protein [Celeribacter indicus]SDW44259.1 DoxX-like family protein [Celeribacter indicus]
MKRDMLRQIFAWLLSAFFVLGGSLNVFATPELVADYERWGYPGWFHYVTGLLEWAAAVLLVPSSTRLLGSGLAAVIMAAAAGTVLAQGEYAHALSPAVVLMLAGLNGWLTWRAQEKAGQP